MSKANVPLSSFSNLGELLKFLRRRVRLSQRELSIATGYSESHLSRIESNDRPLDRTTLVALFVPALHVQEEPEVIARLLALCAAGQTKPASVASEEDATRPVPTIQPTTRSNLPSQLTTFIGRSEELTEVGALLADRKHRLITLTGAGGCGKTRLALRAGEEVAPNYVHGVSLVELAPLSDPQLLTQHVATLFELSETTEQGLLARLSEFLHPRQTLLILDNCEHLVEAAAVLCASLLRSCPQLQILATSRELLGVPGEVPYLVQPLALPPMQLGMPLSPATVEGYDAIRLFVERAHTSLRTFTLTDQNASAVTRICQRLDGIPLGIELAVAWINVLSVGQIADRLAHDFDLLTENSRTLPTRHRTMVAAIEWSYNLLSPQEQRLLRALSIFVGGWDLDAVDAITEGSASPTVLKLLNGLVNKSLVAVEHSPENAVRYRLLEPIREYLREQLIARNEATQLRDRHLAYFVTLAEAAEPQLKSSEQMAWLARLDQEQENLRAAMRWSLDSQKIEEGLRLVGALAHYWEMRFYLVEGSQWCTAMLAAAAQHDGVAHRPWLAKAHFAAGLLGYYLSDIEHSHRHISESLRFYQECEDDAGAGAAFCFLAINHEAVQDVPQAMRDYQAGLRYSQRAEDLWWIAETMH